MSTSNEPLERLLQRIEAAGRLMTHVPYCQHCRAVVGPVGAANELPTAVEVVHVPGCPALQEFDDLEAAEYQVPDDDIR